MEVLEVWLHIGCKHQGRCHGLQLSGPTHSHTAPVTEGVHAQKYMYIKWIIRLPFLYSEIYSKCVLVHWQEYVKRPEQQNNCLFCRMLIHLLVFHRLFVSRCALYVASPLFHVESIFVVIWIVPCCSHFFSLIMLF